MADIDAEARRIRELEAIVRAVEAQRNATLADNARLMAQDEIRGADARAVRSALDAAHDTLIARDQEIGRLKGELAIAKVKIELAKTGANVAGGPGITRAIDAAAANAAKVDAAVQRTIKANNSQPGSSGGERR